MPLLGAALATSLTAPAGAAAPTPTDQLDEVVVTASRSGAGIRADQLGGSVTVLDEAALAQRQTRVVSDILRDVPGFSVSRTGTEGGMTQVRVRGTESNHLLVLVDGMEAADPYQGEFDFATLVADLSSRIEILRGQQSALYGSDAIGGVLNYISTSGRDAPGAAVRVEGGSFGTWEGAARAAGVAGGLDYVLSGGYRSTDGVPTARDGAFGGVRKVGAENGVVSGKLNYAATDDLRYSAVLRYSRTEADTNSQNFDSAFFGRYPYGYVVDGNGHYRNGLLLGMVRAELDAFDDRWTNAVSLQLADADRDGYNGTARTSGNTGSRIKGSYVSTLKIGDGPVRQTLTGAIDVKREKMQNDGPGLNPQQALERTVKNNGFVVQYDVLVNEDLAFGAAVRHDDNDRFEDRTTWRLQGSYRLPSATRLRAAAGTGIKNPTFFELFGFNPNTFIGNPDLKPERSRGWEAGVDQDLAAGRARAAFTYFHSRLQDEIYTAFTPTFVSSPANRTTDSTQKGVEVTFTARLAAQWRIDAAYTHLNADENGAEEVRRPPNTGSVNLAWRTAADRGGLDLTVRYNGSTLDVNSTGVGPARIRLPSYTLVNLGADWRLNERVRAYARIENLLDKDYEEIYTYRAPGIGAYVGLKTSF